MRTLYLLVVIYIALILTGCTTTNITAQLPPPPVLEVKPKCHHHKDPINVSFLNKEKPEVPYQVIGKTTVSKYNPVGNKRQEATLRDLMRQQAASLDGDALINIQHDDKLITATVISYKRILV